MYITDNTYTRGEVLAMEEHVLGVLDFELTAPTAKTFLRRFIQVRAGVSASGCCAYRTGIVWPGLISTPQCMVCECHSIQQSGTH